MSPFKRAPESAAATLEALVEPVDGFGNLRLVIPLKRQAYLRDGNGKETDPAIRLRVKRNPKPAIAIFYSDLFTLESMGAPVERAGHHAQKLVARNSHLLLDCHGITHGCPRF